MTNNINDAMGMFDDIDLSDDNTLIMIIDLLNDLDEKEYEFVLMNNKHTTNKRGVAR